MRYKPRYYAKAFLLAASEKGADVSVLAANLQKTLGRNKDSRKLPNILREIEILEREERGEQKIVAEVAGGASASLTNKIKKAFGLPCTITLRENRELIAGMRIIVNDEVMIDGSAKKRIDNIFKAKIS